jgi:hypothetical protein
MTEFHFPGKHEPEEEGSSRGSHERKLPDFIYIDSEKSTREQESFKGQFRGEMGTHFEKMADKEYPLMLRLFCFVFSALVFLVSLIALMFFLFFLLINLVTFFQMEAFWKQTKNLWEQLKKLIVSGIGLAVAVISPAFGFSIIMVYMLLKGSAMDEDWVSRVMKERFNR